MFELSIDSAFSAAHSIRIRGGNEPLHRHDWRVTLTISAERLDSDGLICDFHLLEESLRAVTSRLHNRNLNESPPFDTTNPTAEIIAKHIADSLALPPGVRLISLRLTEAPGCAATYRP